MARANRSVVFVHGAWHGAWCWGAVVAGLSAAEVDVLAVELPGHGSDRSAPGDLHTDADAVGRVLDGYPDDAVVLVGHSYGGAVITEAGGHRAVHSLVFLCALALSESESCTRVAAGDPAAATISHEGRPDLSLAFIAHDDAVTLEPTRAAALLYNECGPETTAWAVSRLGPQPLITLQQTPRSVAWRSKPSMYAVCTNDLTIHPGLQRIMADRCTSSVTWDSDHSPFLSRPELVVRLLAHEAEHQ